MSKLLFLCFCFFLISCNEQKKEMNEKETPDQREVSEEIVDTARVAGDFLIKGKSAGDFKIGAAIPKALQNYSYTREQRVRRTEEGPVEEELISVSIGNEVLLEILPELDPITRESTEDLGELRIISDRYKTAEGIGVGSSLEEFLKAYPEHKIWYTYVSDRYIVETEAVEAQFLLDSSDFTGKKTISSEVTPLKRNDFRDGARIQMIRIY